MTFITITSVSIESFCPSVMADGGTSAGDEKAGKLWGGRFTGVLDPVMEKFNSSLRYDKVMYEQDIEVLKVMFEQHIEVLKVMFE